jgi:hypothetical protein
VIIMRIAIPAFAALATVAVLAGCERPAPTTSTTTIVKEPIVQKETTKETIVQAPAPAPAEPAKPPQTETTQTTTRTRDTPYGTATKTESTTTKTTP